MNNGNNGHQPVLASDGRSAFARLFREIERELLSRQAYQDIETAREEIRVRGKGLCSPHMLGVAAMTPEEHMDALFPAGRREISQQARRLALAEVRLNREIGEFFESGDD